MIKYKENINKLNIEVETLKPENERHNLKTLHDEQRITDVARQHCCLSPFLFSILLEVFTSVLIKRKEKNLPNQKRKAKV